MKVAPLLTAKPVGRGASTLFARDPAAESFSAETAAGTDRGAGYFVEVVRHP
jgi:hypothetical protein